MKILQRTELKRFLKKIPKHPLNIVLILENIQYASNVASVFRTADASKVSEIYLTGSTHTPPFGKNLRKASRSKEKSVKWKYKKTTGLAINQLRRKGYKILALEITDQSKPIKSFATSNPDTNIAIILGNEVSGISRNTLAKVDDAIFIPMYGKGASLNVAVSCAIMLYILIILNKSNEA